MRLHRFYHSEKIGDKKEFTISSAEFANQISRVFRLSVRDRVVVFDGSGNDYVCELLEVSPRGPVVLRVVEISPSKFMPSRKIFLFQSIIKKDKFEWVVEKATELGVTDIVPVLVERSEKKDLNIERLCKIAIEASEQCGRGDVPMISTARRGLDECLSTDCQKMVLHLEGENFITGKPGHEDGDGPIGVFIGPEGGWSPDEVEMFHKNNVPIYSLGKQVLRAETAAVATLSLVVF
jgi:16S rRNA (uracil1498-N3)-methyltransferase